MILDTLDRLNEKSVSGIQTVETRLRNYCQLAHGQEGWVSFIILKLAKLSVILCSFNVNCQTLNEKLIIVVQVWEGQGVIKYGRKLIGATSPQASEPGTIRGDLCVQVSRLVPFKFRLLFTSLQL